MTSEQIAALCDAAHKRLMIFVERSAGQHLRAMRKSWSKK